MYTPLYRKPFAILKITYTRQAPKCLISVLLSYTLFSNFPFSSSKIAYTLPRHACVYAPMKKALHYLENSVYSARNCKVLRYLTPALLVYTLLWRKPFIVLIKAYTLLRRYRPSIMPDLSPSRVYAFLKDILPFFKNNVYSPGPKMPDLGLLLVYTLFSNFPFSSSKIAYTLPRPTVCIRLYIENPSLS